MIDQDLLTEIQYALLEPPDGGSGWPSALWTRDEVIGNLNSNTWDWLRATLALATPLDIAQAAVLNGIVTLPADWMATVEMNWRDTATGIRTPIDPIDRFEADLGFPTWQDTPSLPIGYVELEGDTLTQELVPHNAADGTVELLYVARTATIAGEGLVLPVPEEFLSGIKYGTLGMLLRKVGRSLDPERAGYCEQRLQLTIEVTKILMRGWA